MSWAWRDRDREKNAQLNLLYEPGNWGDVLKGTWLAILGEHMNVGRYVDPHAGAKDYPLLEPVRERLRECPTYSRVAVSGERLLSSASIVRKLWPQAECHLNEPDQDRRETWDIPCDGRDGRELLEKIQAPNGAAGAAPKEAAAEAAKGATDRTAERAARSASLVLWDPYDFFEQWSHVIGDLVKLDCAVLIYLYNKSCRGVSQARQYASLRKRLPQTAWCGRIPSDGLLPRAYHEMILLNGPPSARDPLKRATTGLHLALSAQNAFEG